MLVNLIILLAVGFCAGWLLLTLFTAWLLTHPSKRGYAYAVARGLPGDPGEVRLVPAPSPTGVDIGANGLSFTSLTFKGTASKPLHAWNITGGDPEGPIVIASHGWGESRVMMLSRMPGLWPAASRIILWDSSGHGDSPGLCTLGVREVDDLNAIIEHVRGSADHRAIALYGFSLGAGVAIVSAARDQQIALVIAEAPYRVPLTPARNVLALRGLPAGSTLRAAMLLIGARLGFGASWAMDGPAGGFDRLAHADRLPESTRLFVIRGTDDTICPQSDAGSIAHAGRGRIVEIAGAGHGSLWRDPAHALHAAALIRETLRSLRNNRPPSHPADAQRVFGVNE